MTIPIHRRFLIAIICLALSAVLFRGSVAVALISRGDEFFQKGHPQQARIYYARALFFDGASTLAADRYAFSGLELRTPQALRSSIIVATQALKQNPDDVTLLEDRALLYQAEQRYAQAYPDFMHVAEITRDLRWYHLAKRSAYRSGKTRFGQTPMEPRS